MVLFPAGMSWDSITMATPLDTLKTQLGLELSVNEIHDHKVYRFPCLVLSGVLAGNGSMAYNLLWRTVVSPVAGCLTGVSRPVYWACYFLLSNSFALYDYASFMPPTFHLFSGGIMLGAFFYRHRSSPVPAPHPKDAGYLVPVLVSLFL